jgi:hypothetical protein
LTARRLAANVPCPPSIAIRDNATGSTKTVSATAQAAAVFIRLRRL